MHHALSSAMLQKNFLELTLGERIFRTVTLRSDYSNDRQFTLGIELRRALDRLADGATTSDPCVNEVNEAF